VLQVVIKVDKLQLEHSVTTNQAVESQMVDTTPTSDKAKMDSPSQFLVRDNQV